MGLAFVLPSMNTELGSSKYEGHASRTIPQAMVLSSLSSSFGAMLLFLIIQGILPFELCKKAIHISLYLLQVPIIGVVSVFSIGRDFPSLHCSFDAF